MYQRFITGLCSKKVSTKKCVYKFVDTKKCRHFFILTRDFGLFMVFRQAQHQILFEIVRFKVTVLANVQGMQYRKNWALRLFQYYFLAGKTLY